MRTSTEETYQRISRDAYTFIEHNVGNPDLSLDRFCATSHVSRRSAQRAFRAHQRTWRKMVAQIRTRDAGRLLRETDKDVKEIAKAVGLTHHHFTDLFKRETGRTPTAYRRAVRGDA